MMKRTKLLFSLLVAAVFSVAFVSCDKDENELPRISVNPEECVVTYAGATHGLTVTANRDWTLSITPASAAEWLTVSDTCGSGTMPLTIDVAPNDESFDYRHAVITFFLDDCGKNEVATLHVVQGYKLDVE